MKKKMMMDAFLIMLYAGIAKFLSFIIRILFARTLSVEAMHYYTLISPTLMLALTLSQLSLPTALSKLIAKHQQQPFLLKANTKLLTYLNLIVMISLLLFTPLLSSLLSDHPLHLLIYTMLPILPLTSISATLKARLSGMQRHRSAAFSQIPEEVVRILFLFLFYPYLRAMNDLHAAAAVLCSISISEIGSIIYLYFNLPKQKRHSTTLVKRPIYKEFLQLAIPASLSRLTGSLTYFLEPLLLSLLSLNHYLNDYTLIYGYLMPLITMPSFLSISLSNYLLPSFVYYQEKKEYSKASKLCFCILASCAFIGITSSLLCYFKADLLLNFLYHNTNGSTLLKSLAMPFAIFSLQPALASLMHALNLSSQSFYDTFYGCILRLAILFFAPYLNAHLLVLSLVSSMLLTTCLHALRISIVLLKR